MRNVIGQHVRWIDNESGYSKHGTYYGHTWHIKPLCRVVESDGTKHVIDGDFLEWYSPEAYPIKEL